MTNRHERVFQCLANLQSSHVASPLSPTSLYICTQATLTLLISFPHLYPERLTKCPFVSTCLLLTTMSMLVGFQRPPQNLTHGESRSDPHVLRRTLCRRYTVRLSLSRRALSSFSDQVYLAWLQDDLVTFNPDYQQSTSSESHLVLSLTLTFTGVAWTNAKQVGLINSLFNNYYIAPIIFSTFGAPPISTFSCFPQV